MPVNEIRLGDIVWIDSFAQVANGRLVQFRHEDRIYIGLKTSYSVANGIASAALVLEQGNEGLMIDGATIIGPLLDVTELVEIVALKPCEKVGISGAPRKGALYQDKSTPGVLWVYGETETQVKVYVCVHTQGSIQLGSALPLLVAGGVSMVAPTIMYREL